MRTKALKLDGRPASRSKAVLSRSNRHASAKAVKDPGSTGRDAPAPDTSKGARRANLSERVRQIRRENNWTLQDLSDMTGVAPSTLSKLENSQVDVSFETVMRICDGLDLSLEHLTSHKQVPFSSGVRTVTRRNEGLQLTTSAYDFEVLCADIAKKGLLPVIVTVKARSSGALVQKTQHPGEEFIYVIRGRIELHTEFYEPTVLKEGDSAYYDSSRPHAFTNASAGDAIVLSVSHDSSGKHQGVTGHLNLDVQPGKHR